MASTAPKTPIDPAFAAESNVPRIIGVLTVFHFLAWVFVGMRIYTRLVLLRSPGWDDLFIVLGSVRLFFGIAGGRRWASSVLASRC